MGDEIAVAEFVARWEAETGVAVRSVGLSGSDRTTAIAHASALGSTAATTVHYIRALHNVPTGGSATLRLWVTNASGRIVSNRAVGPPPVVLAMIALNAATQAATDRISEALERVEGKTDELLRLAGAERTGDVVGHHRLLRRRVDRIDQGGSLGEVDWSTVAYLGPELEVSVERLREHALRLARDLPPGLTAPERARRLERVVADGRLGEVLRLLVVAEQSHYLWQRLRITRISTIEPDSLDEAVSDAHAVLAEHLHADSILVENLRDTLDAYGVLKPSEFHRTLSGRKLRSSVQTLRRDLDYFVTARGVQVQGWVSLVAPTVRDALRHARTVAIESGRAVRGLGSTALDSGLAGVSRAGGAVQATADRWRTTPPDDSHEQKHPDGIVVSDTESTSAVTPERSAQESEPVD
ncbi:hypothetical protein PP1_029695 [Pseudonocardia sp. P1]